MEEFGDILKIDRNTKFYKLNIFLEVMKRLTKIIGMSSLAGVLAMGIFLKSDFSLDITNNHPYYDICITYDKKEINASQAIETARGENFIIYEQPISSSKAICVRYKIGKFFE